jgi:hypothetical protein
MQLIPALTACVLALSASGTASAANSTRIAETGAYLLGNAHRCGVTDERVVRAGKVIRELIAAAADGDGERNAAKTRFAEIFRATARVDADGHAATPPCKTVVGQFERLEQFRARRDPVR